MPNHSKRTHVTRAIFQSATNISSAQLPDWLKKKASVIPSIAPETAAALLHRAGGSANNNAEPSLTIDGTLKPQEADDADPGTEGLDSAIASTSQQNAHHQKIAFETQLADQQAQLDAQLVELKQAISSLHASRTSLLADLSPQIYSLTRLISQRVLLTEVPQENELASRLIRESLEMLDGSAGFVVTLGPGFEAQAGSLQTDLEEEGISCDVQVKPQLSTYACTVRSPMGCVNSAIETRLDHILRALDEEQVDG